MYIYRIEHEKTCEGPYTAEIIFNDMRQSNMGSEHMDRDHPGMWIDCKRNAQYCADSYFCGFLSIEQCTAWFDGWFDTLQNNGFILVIYRVESDYIARGKKQCAFIKQFATIVDSMRLDEVVSCQ